MSSNLRINDNPGAAYSGSLSAEGAEILAAHYDNYNPTGHYESLGRRSEMKSSISQVQDAYISKEEAMKKMVDRFCKSVGDNGLLCPRDRIRHKLDNAVIRYFQQENPSGVISDKIPQSLDMDKIETPYTQCSDNSDHKMSFCIKGQAGRYLSGSSGSSCAGRADRYVSDRLYSIPYDEDYKEATQETPDACEAQVSNLPRYHELQEKNYGTPLPSAGSDVMN